MAYTTYDELEFLNGSIRLEDCTPAEENEPAPFYPEDLIRISLQPNFYAVRKKMAKFWGERWQVWVGYDQNDQFLGDVIALRCPPYYQPYTTAGVRLTANDPQRAEFEARKK